MIAENSTISKNLAAVERRISDACLAAGRPVTDVRLLPVSKTRPASALVEAMACGYRRFGENRVQEVVAKAAELPDAEWAVIGHLQSNKARQVA
ncbi:MAG TPA: YggS family pyridoxal phosphate-dependent enzyme, partial [Propionibacteriaceae bacterium]|nr:YggS family pyridoxal phosphate-dependent enzyme [Propionibacteriaceae bacterium]